MRAKSHPYVPDSHRVVPAERDADPAGGDDVGHGGGERRAESADGREVPRAAHPAAQREDGVGGGGGQVAVVFDVETCKISYHKNIILTQKSHQRFKMYISDIKGEG